MAQPRQGFRALHPYDRKMNICKACLQTDKLRRGLHELLPAPAIVARAPLATSGCCIAPRCVASACQHPAVTFSLVVPPLIGGGYVSLLNHPSGAWSRIPSVCCVPTY